MKGSMFIIALLVTSLVAGCILSESRSPEVQYGAPEDSDFAVMPAMEKGGGFLSASEEADAETYTTTTTTIDRKIIKTARISMEVQDFDSAATVVEQLAQATDGFVSDSNSYVTDTGQKRGSITIRVPEEGFLSVLEEVKKLGEVKSTSSSGQDVTEEYIDLDARLRNLERQEGRLLDILDNATTVEDLLEVEKELGRIRGEIEVITGRLRYLDERISLATITVELSEPTPITHSWGLRDALSESVEGFIYSTNALIVFIGGITPWVVFAALLFGAYRWRKKKRSKEI